MLELIKSNLNSRNLTLLVEEQLEIISLEYSVESSDKSEGYVSSENESSVATSVLSSKVPTEFSIVLWSNLKLVTYKPEIISKLVDI